LGAEIARFGVWLAFCGACAGSANKTRAPAPDSAKESSLPSRGAIGPTLDASTIDARVSFNQGPDAPSSEVQTSAEYELLGDRFRLETRADSCWVIHRSAGGNREERLSLDMQPPCYLLTWDRDLPRYDAQGASDGVAVGKKGSVRAYRYPGRSGSFAVIIVIGGPTKDERAKTWKDHHCGGAARGLIWRANSLRLSKVEYDSYFNCVESGGPDEKDYWIMGHDG
jgi:hypothetical protein